MLTPFEDLLYRHRARSDMPDPLAQFCPTYCTPEGGRALDPCDTLILIAAIQTLANEVDRRCD